MNLHYIIQKICNEYYELMNKYFCLVDFQLSALILIKLKFYQFIVLDRNFWTLMETDPHPLIILKRNNDKIVFMET